MSWCGGVSVGHGTIEHVFDDASSEPPRDEAVLVARIAVLEREKAAAAGRVDAEPNVFYLCTDDHTTIPAA